MLDSTARRWLVGTMAVLAVIALLAWARNDPGVGGRQPDPPTSNVTVAVVTTVDSGPPTT